MNPHPNIHQFLHTWITGFNDWFLVQRASIPVHLVRAFVKDIQAFFAEGSFRFQTLPTQEGQKGKKRKSAFSSGLKHNWRLLLRESRIREVEAEGRVVVFSGWLRYHS